MLDYIEKLVVKKGELFDYDEYENIHDEAFNEFIDEIFRYTDVISFEKILFGAAPTCIDRSLEDELEPYIISRVSSLKWFGYDYTNPPTPEDQRIIDTNLYIANDETKGLLKKYYRSIFLDEKEEIIINKSVLIPKVKELYRKLDPEIYDYLVENGDLFLPMQTLDNLCFFAKGKMLVGTITHENMLSAYPPNKEFEEILFKYGEWEARTDQYRPEFTEGYKELK